MADHEVFEEPNFVLQKGALLPVARLAYKTVGTLNAARDNAVLVPSWYTGTHNDTKAYMLGETRALDPRRYFIILTNLLANGVSSSPSNTPAPFERGRFPNVTIYDNVRLQQLLLTRHLGIERLRLVTGWSMGACQVYQWAAQYPDMVRAACPIAGSARTARYNQVFLLALRRALELDPIFDEGFYDRPPVRGLKAFPQHQQQVDPEVQWHALSRLHKGFFADRLPVAAIGIVLGPRAARAAPRNLARAMR